MSNPVVQLEAGKRPEAQQVGRLSPLSWANVFDAQVHPAKIFILEALDHVGLPLSAKEVNKMADGKRGEVVSWAYHLRQLAKENLVHRTHQAPYRGALEAFYFYEPL
jgi:hypothetical protein